MPFRHDVNRVQDPNYLPTSRQISLGKLGTSTDLPIFSPHMILLRLWLGNLWNQISCWSNHFFLVKWLWVKTYGAIFGWMNIHLPSVLMFTRVPQFWPMAKSPPSAPPRHVRDARDVQSTAHDVGGHQQLDLAIPEALRVALHWIHGYPWWITGWSWDNHWYLMIIWYVYITASYHAYTNWIINGNIRGIDGIKSIDLAKYGKSKGNILDIWRFPWYWLHYTTCHSSKQTSIWMRSFPLGQWLDLMRDVNCCSAFSRRQTCHHICLVIHADGFGTLILVILLSRFRWMFQDFPFSSGAQICQETGHATSWTSWTR